MESSSGHAQAYTQRSLIRKVCFLLDCSEGMAHTDRRASVTRVQAVKSAVMDFQRAFFESSPLSSLAIATTRNCLGHLACPLTHSSATFVEALESEFNMHSLSGMPSLENGLRVAAAEVTQQGTEYRTSSYEIIVVFGSLATVDHGYVIGLIEALNKRRITCNVVCLSGAPHVLEKLATDTGGQFRVPLNFQQLSRTVLRWSEAPSVQKSLRAADDGKLVTVAFPTKWHDDGVQCECHPNAVPQDERRARLLQEEIKKVPTIACSQCGARHCSLPTECVNCGIILSTPSNLARSFCVMYPQVPPSDCSRTPKDEMEDVCSTCNGVLGDAPHKLQYKCERCQEVRCTRCEKMARKHLLICPTCL